MDTNNTNFDSLRRNTIVGLLALFAVYSILLNASFTVTHAKSLTEVFTTDAFTGSWEVFSKFNFLGKLMNFIISAFSLLGLFIVAWQRLVTLLYLSGRTLFDRVHEIKSSGKGQKFLGLPAIFQSTIMNSQYGTGADSIVSFLLSLLPDVKEASDYSEGNRQYNLEDTDSVTQYILKVSIPTIMIIFFFTIGFSGTYFQIYGNIVEGMATVADNFVDTKLSKYVDRLINKGAAYKFAYADDGSNIGKMRQSIASDIYTKVLKNIENPNSDATLLIGQQVDSIVEQHYTAEAISVALGSVNDSNESKLKWDGSDETAKNVQYSVTVNARSEPYSGEVAGAPFSLADLSCGFPMSGTYANEGGIGYVHVVFNKKNNAEEHNYFQTPDEKTSGGRGKDASNPEKAD